MPFVTMNASRTGDLQPERPATWRKVGSALVGIDFKQLANRVAAQEQVGASAVLLTGFLILLNKYAGYECIPVRHSVGGRQAQDAILAVELAASSEVSAVAAAVNRQLSDGQMPGGEAQALHPQVFAWMREAAHDHEHPEDAVLGLVCTSHAGELHVEFRYRDDVLESWFVEQMMEHLAAILQEWLDRPQVSIEQLKLLSEAERARIFRFSEGESRRYPIDRTLLEMFEACVQQHPDREAVVEQLEDGSLKRLTYRMLNQRADLLASRLAALGVTSQVAVGVHFNRSADLVVAIVAILKVGGIYVPLDRAYPEEYLRFILEDTDAQVLLTSGEAHGGLGRIRAHVVNVQEIDWQSHSALRRPVHRPQATDPLVIMYTSGSTGKPKGVKHCQLQVINRLHWMWEDYPFRDGDVIAQRSPMNVMPSMWEMLGGLLGGIPTVIVPTRLMTAPAELAEFLAMQRVTYMTITPTLMRLMIASKEQAAAWPSQLRLVIIGGEPLTDNVYRAFRNDFPATVLVNDFGATEVNTILHAAYPPSHAESVQAKGYIPIANVSTYLLDDSLHPVPFGVAGEMYVAGPCVALGYQNLPSQTDQRFVLWRKEEGAAEQRVYRTGELAYMMPDGSIRVTGRKDHQVKINGLRVELGEVEGVLNGHPAIRECAVVEAEYSRGKKLLHAFLCPKEGAIPARTELIAYVQAHLPDYMTPARFVQVDQLPRLHNGKLDRMTLRERATEREADNSQANVLLRNESLAFRLKAIAGDLLDRDAHAIRQDEEFAALGFDSILLVEFAQEITKEMRLKISVDTLFEQTTLRKLTDYVGHALQKQQVAEDAEQDLVAADNRKARDGERSIAIIGMSGRFPGARNIRELWDNLCQGVDSVTTVPSDRWDVEAIFDPDPTKSHRTYSKWGGFLSGVDEFDPLFFKISPREAQMMDPQQRLCLMEAWRALEDAGYAPNQEDPEEVGVFVGARESDYPKLVSEAGITPGAETQLGSDMALLAARISYFCNLKGPSLVVNTACSSSMVALHLACQSLLNGESRLALAGGVCVTNDPDFYVGTSKMNVFSPTGRCRTFDDQADGFVHGEGVVFVVLKPLQDALDDGDNIYAVIRGTAVNQDGRSNGITAPNGLAQTALQESLYRRLGIEPDTISYVEAHGTGTRLGDLIELQSLTRTFRKFTEQKRFCAIGSMKTNIGHLTAAAGLASVVKTALCLHHRELVSSLHFNTPNALVDFEGSPFNVNTKRLPWTTRSGMPRRAAINSFGIGGTNAHGVLEEAPMVPRKSLAERPAYLVPVTARTEESLRLQLQELHDWLREMTSRPRWTDIAFTLCTGRHLFEHGYVFLARSVEEWAEQLHQVLTGTQPAFVRSLGGADANVRLEERGRYLMREASRERQGYVERLHEIADLIAQGFRPDWTELFDRDSARRISMPTYCFLRERYWVPKPNESTRPHVPRVVESHAAELAVAEAAVALEQNAQKWSEWLAEVLGEELGLAADRIDPRVALEAYGFDSIKAVGLKYRLELALGRELSVNDLMESPSLQAMAERLCELGGDVTGSKPEQTPPSSADDLAERFLDGSLELSALTDEQLNQLHVQLKERGGL